MLNRTDDPALPLCDLCGAEMHLGERCTVPIVEGGRHDTMLRVVWRLNRSHAFPGSSLFAFAFRENERRCKPPLPKQEVYDLVRTAMEKRRRGGHG
jgi:hypothetical protein